ncbi:MAG TPA: C4-dicarboxylate ABC transporter substrate-binding protein, partial [Burkholderiaceae bacterium]|nr:C4-dicarboxylate ABC transporter substrate-binding protein [Burkholderiaceae bacterium]
MIAVLRARAKRAIDRLYEVFGRGVVLTVTLLLLIGLGVALASFGFFDAAAPSELTIASGPDGSSFRRTADQYQKILAREGVTLKIVPSEGSRDNLARLSDPNT